MNLRPAPLRLLTTTTVAACLLSAGCALDDPGSAASDAAMLKETAPADVDTGHCGDRVAIGREHCDRDDLAGMACSDFGYEGGELACQEDCRGFDVSGCTGPGVCGNGFIDDGEECDDANTALVDCPGYDEPCEVCLPDCTFGAGRMSTCGDGVADSDGEETCDGDDYGEGTELTCADLGWSGGGELGCLDDCSWYDTSDCIGFNCGDGALQDGEECDDGAANSDECEYGDTACTVCRLDCTEGPGATSYCGDGVVAGPEDCEVGDTSTHECPEGPAIGCTDRCKWDYDACPSDDVGADGGGTDTATPDQDAAADAPGLGADSDAGLPGNDAGSGAGSGAESRGCASAGGSATAPSSAWSWTVLVAGCLGFAVRCRARTKG